MDDAKSKAPHLVNKQAFQAILQDYKMSDRAKEAFQKLRLVLLGGPSAVGRNTIIDYLVKGGAYHYVVSDTTRPPRVNNGILEQNGRQYWFRTEEEILRDLEAGEFLEAEIIHDQQVSGISLRELEQAAAEGKTPINEVEIGGLLTVLREKPNTLAILMLPPSFDEWQRRLIGRGEISTTEFKNRLETAVRIFAQATQKVEGLTLLVNENVEQAAAQVDRLARGGAVDPEQQQAARKLAEELLKKTQDLLQTVE